MATLLAPEQVRSLAPQLQARCCFRRVWLRRTQARSLWRAPPPPRLRRLRRLRPAGAVAGQALSSECDDKAQAGAYNQRRRRRRTQHRWRAMLRQRCRAALPRTAHRSPPPHLLLPFILIFILILSAPLSLRTLRPSPLPLLLPTPLPHHFRRRRRTLFLSPLTSATYYLTLASRMRSSAGNTTVHTVVHSQRTAPHPRSGLSRHLRPGLPPLPSWVA